MLQRDGLIEAELNRRVRVAAISFEDLEQLYALRIVTESLALRASVDRFTAADLASMERALEEMNVLAGGDIAALGSNPIAGFTRVLSHTGATGFFGNANNGSNIRNDIGASTSAPIAVSMTGVKGRGSTGRSTTRASSGRHR